MKVFLMYEDSDFDLDRSQPGNENELTQDLELETLLRAMSRGDKFLFEVARKALFCSLTEPAEIVFRQDILADCLAHPEIVRSMYAIAVQAVDGERKIYRGFWDNPEIILHRSIEVLEFFVGLLKKLTRMAHEHAAQFCSTGFQRLFDMLMTELDDEYLRAVQAHLKQLRFDGGVLISARLDRGNKGRDYVIRRDPKPKQSWRQRLSFFERSPYTLEIADRDEGGMRALGELRGRGVNLAANALAQSSDHVLSFFTMLRAELGFYVGCLNLAEQLDAQGEPRCFPAPLPLGERVLSGRGLYDVCLCLVLKERVVGNDLGADGKSLIMITGANQGGKSTFLRSIGLAQLMMQCGMFVAAERFRAEVGDAIFTHYKREEDPTMTSGKLDEELSRMSQIVDIARPDSLLLFNESFSATNEREGAEIAGSIVQALLENDMKVCFVSHSFELAHRFHSEARDNALFLRAERQADGTRTFKLLEGEPLPTSFGEDLYQRVFKGSADDARVVV